MVAPTVYFEFHSSEGEISQFIFIPRSARRDGTFTLPYLFSRTVTETNPQRTFARASGVDITAPSGELSVRQAVEAVAVSLNNLMPQLTRSVMDRTTTLYNYPLVVYISDQEIEELASDETLPRTYRDRFGRARASQVPEWKPLPERKN